MNIDTDQQSALRAHVVALVEAGYAFETPAAILANVPTHVRGVRPDGFDHSLWELLEHVRIDQRDLLDFCVASEYAELAVPAEIWPVSVEPPDDEAWDASVASFIADNEEAKAIASNEAIDLLAVVPRGTGPTQTWLRHLMLIAEHNAYHLGQIVVLRKRLGVWP